jgi:hypothetical protein
MPEESEMCANFVIVYCDKSMVILPANNAQSNPLFHIPFLE